MRRRPRFVPSLIESLETRRLLANVLGVDAASFQYDLNWADIKADGYTFAYEKAVQGTYYTNSYWSYNISQAKANGIPIGSYDFADFGDDPTSSANYFWNEIKSTVSGDGLTLEPMLDAEKYQTGNEDSWIATWSSVLVADAKTAGITIQPIVYTYQSWDKSYLTSTTGNSFPLWFALPGSTAPTSSNYGPAWNSYEVWQYGETGYIPTTDGQGSVKADADQLNGDANELRNLIVGTGKFPPNSTVATTASATAYQNPGTGTTHSVPTSTQGTVLKTPVYYSNAWYVDVSFTNGVSGWVKQTSLQAISGPPAAPGNSAPANGSTIYSTPTLTWNSSSGATSYNVFLNNSEIASGLTTTSYTPSTLSAGAYNWYVQAHNSFGNTNGSAWSFTIALVSPTASFTRQVPILGASVFDFTVDYTNTSHPTAQVDTTSFGDGNITVTGPNGYSQNATFISQSQPGNGTNRSATYEIDAPSDVWNAQANGIYTINLNANQVADVAGGYATAGSVGTFTVNDPFAYLQNNQVFITSIPGSLALTWSQSGNNWVAANNLGTNLFSPGTFTSVVFIGTSGNDSLSISSPMSVPLYYNGGSGQDTLNLSAGSLTFGSDLGATTSALTLNVSGNAGVNFNSNQHLAALNLSGSATAALPAGGAIALDTQSLSITGSAYIDVADNALAVESGDAADIDAYLTSGNNGGLWNGPGINSHIAAGSFGHSLGFSPASNLGYSSINGVSFSNTAIVVRYTFLGDANLDATVNADDISLMMLAIAQGQSQSQQGQTLLAPNSQSETPAPTYWYNGDYNYDNQVNQDDFLLLSLGSAVENQQMLT